MKNIDFNRVANQVSDFLSRHKIHLHKITSKSTNVFEAFCFVLFVRYYEVAGYELKPQNMLDGKFRFKYNTRGYPWNYSYFVATSESSEQNQDSTILFEIRHNLKVAGAWIEKQAEETYPPMFALDIAVVKPNSLPHLKRGQKREKEKYWAENNHLITFGEAKKLTAYPMLLAQFLGIVHEIKPEFLNPEEARASATISQQHPPPTLFTANHLTEGTKKVLQSFEERGFSVRVIENVVISPEQILVSKMRGENEQELDISSVPVPF